MQVQAVDVGIRVNMENSTNRLFCRLDGLTSAIREEKRITALKSLGLLEVGSIPLFDEATQTTARFIEAPICILGLMVNEQLWLKSAIGLSRLGLMNQLASSRQIPRQEAFSTYVIDSEQNLIINDTLTDPVFANSILVQHYGIRAYLGTPLITTGGQCIGALAVMDLVPRYFNTKDLEFLALSARWCLREFERDHLLKSQPSEFAETFKEPIILPKLLEKDDSSFAVESNNNSTTATTLSISTNALKLRLLRQLSEELRTPLTSVVGMASVLRDEVFGSLTNKQKEYIEIIHNSGQQMNSLVEEIIKLGVATDKISKLQLTPVNIEMLCQQAINSLAKVAGQKRLSLRLSIEPGKRIWLLDKEQVRQALFYLVISVIESSEAGGEVRIHVSRRNNMLNIAVWVSHPWLGDGLPQVKLYSSSITQGIPLKEKIGVSADCSQMNEPLLGNHILNSASLEAALHSLQDLQQKPDKSKIQELLGLLLGCHLAERHGGKIMVQGSPESGYRYVLTLPKIDPEEG